MAQPMRRSGVFIAVAGLAAVCASSCKLAEPDVVARAPALPIAGGDAGASNEDPDALDAPGLPDAPEGDATPDAAVVMDVDSRESAARPDATDLAWVDGANPPGRADARSPCTEGPYVFCETFEHGAGLWMPNGGSWAIIDSTDDGGTSEGYGPTIPVASQAYAAFPGWSDMTAEARLLVTSNSPPSSTNRVEVFARYVDSSHNYAIAMRSDGKLVLRRNGVALGDAATVSLAMSEWHTLAVRVSGAPGAVTVEGSLDGKLVLAATDTDADGSPGGTVAIGVYGSTLAVFDDVRVSVP